MTGTNMIGEGSSGSDDVAYSPSDAADDNHVVRANLPADILDKYEIYSYRSAALILAQSHPRQFEDILTMLREFTLTTSMIRKAGGNESEIPKRISLILRAREWFETTIQGDLHIRLASKRPSKAQKTKTSVSETRLLRERFLDGHRIDYVKGRVAFDVEWNSKDQTFDRDLYAFRTFAECGVIDVGVLLTRSAELNEVFSALGYAETKDGTQPKKTIKAKYGASTTWMGKLLFRLNAGRAGSCPVLAIGITPRCIEDWPR